MGQRQQMGRIDRYTPQHIFSPRERCNTPFQRYSIAELPRYFPRRVNHNLATAGRKGPAIVVGTIPNQDDE